MGRGRRHSLLPMADRRRGYKSNNDLTGADLNIVYSWVVCLLPSLVGMALTLHGTSLGEASSGWS